jgi:hypothetical protein
MLLARSKAPRRRPLPFLSYRKDWRIRVRLLLLALRRGLLRKPLSRAAL